MTVGLGSIALYLAAFFFPEIHRKNDFILSGVGLFYALVLWIFAPRITGGLLLGHVASVALLGWFGWQTLSLRRQLTPTAQQTQIPSADEVKTNLQSSVSQLSLQERLAPLQQWFSRTFSRPKDKVQHTGVTKTSETSKAAVSPTAAPTVEIVDQRSATQEHPTTDTETATPTSGQPAEAVAPVDSEAKTKLATEPIPPNPPSWQLVEAAQESSEDKTPPLPVVEVAPDAELAPPAEAPPEQLPSNPPTQGS
ncbi:Ycf66 family protein [Scytonema sp. UIC 10036]|uniref:Ycf66 family protein n=1 Tax=Scytonema sp. UIC 10036 TaxID=2304196 RepID=UPI001FAA2375|nr:Ycf66 family protein [Scytonema sp. UIC 10036]